MRRTHLTGTMIAVALVATLAIAAPTARAGDVDVTQAGAVVLQDGAYYIQGPLPTSAGTGLIDPFLTDGGGGSQDITRSYNTDGTAEFDTVTGGDRTRSLNLAAVPEQEYNGVLYKEFVLDINKTSGADPYLAMNELQLWLTDSPNLTGYDLPTYSFPSGATKIFDLDEGDSGDIAVLMDYSLESGSGASDLTWLVPLSVFGNDPDCTYGNTACTTYVVLFNEYGNYTEEGADPDKWVNNDGFEEWGTVLRPVVQVTKTAAGTYDRVVTWTLDKSVDAAAHSGVAGQAAGTSTWQVVADKTVAEGNIAAGGTITILNPTGGAGNPIDEAINAVILSVDDVITQGGTDTTATVDCGVAFPYTLGAGDTLECSYTASPGTTDPGVNQATATIEGLDNPDTPEQEASTFSGTADLAFAAILTGYESGTLSDDNPYNPNPQTVISGDTTWTYGQTFDCPADTSLYVNGSYSFDVPNTAVLNGNLNLSDTELVSVTCTLPALVPSKTATGSYDRTVTWTLDKTVDVDSHSGSAGDSFNSTWTVVADKTEVSDNYRVAGTISIYNPGGVARTFSVTDVLDDGTPVAVDCPTDTVAADATVICTYEAFPADGSATLNTATIASSGNPDQTATAAVSFVENLIGYDSGTLSDPRFTYSQLIEGDTTQNFPDTFECPVDASRYDNGSYSFTVPNQATLNGNINLTASAEVTVACTLPALVPSKTAAGSYDRTVTWTLDKTVDVGSHSGNAGDSFNSTWTVVADKTEESDNYEVSGTIRIDNPASIAQTFSISDVLDDGTAATVSCPSNTVAAGSFVECTYTAVPADGSATLNTATVSAAGNPDQTATAAVSFEENLIGYDSGTLADPRFEYSQLIGDDTTENFPDSFECPVDASRYDNGSYSFTVPNEATLNGNINLTASAEVTVACTLQPLVPSKTAAGSYDRTVTWTLEKSVDVDSYSGFVGDSFSSIWTVVADKTEVSDNYKVTGTIRIDNPASIDQTFSVSDMLDDGTSASVDCPSSTVAAGGFVECSYTAMPADDSAKLNTATVSAAGNPDQTATAAVTFTENLIGDDTVTVDDDRDTEGQFPASISSSTTFDYAETFTCSSNQGDYTDGVDTDAYPNTATLTGDSTNLSDNAQVDLTCYLPSVSKTVTPAWEQNFQWDIAKNVDGTEFMGFVGDSWAFDYDIDVTLTTYDELNFSASGVITVVNPNPSDPLTVALSDAVDVFTGVITSDGDCAFDGTNLTIPAGGTATCDYTVDMGDALDDGQATQYTNTATASYKGETFGGTATFTFGDVDPTLAAGSEPSEVTSTDDNATPGDTGDDHHSATITETTSDVISYQQGDICPTDHTLYTNGVYTLTLTNVAVLDQTDDSDSETVTITCRIPALAKVVKATTEGDEDIGQFPFQFGLFEPGADSSDLGNAVEEGTLDAAGEIIFETELETEGDWTVAEFLPEGWFSETELSCTISIAYPGSAGQTYTCNFDNTEASRVDLVKLTNGLYDPTKTWTFTVYQGPDGFGGDEVASDKTPTDLADAGLLRFGDVNLDPGATYTICELGVPAGYSTVWALDTNNDGFIGNGDSLVPPYNPNADDNPPEDLGNRCVDFGAGTTMPAIPLVPGETLHFIVDNQFPGGAPRTPGYWKNWNTCTNGGQANTAAANGGWEEGYWLLEDVLDPNIGGGIVWDDILTDDFEFPITDCTDAVLILDKRDLDGKKQASDPLHNLATHLLAAQLNFGAGACTTQDALLWALEAEELLDKYNFDGDGHDRLNKKDPDAQLANELATYLDDYNNGLYCGDSNE